MRKIHTFIMVLIVGLTQTTVNAQLIIGGDTDNPHPHALLQIESDGRGFILPSVEQRNQLPNVDPITGDHVANPNDDGVVIYSKEDKDLVRFDGNKWENASRKTLLGSRNISILSSNQEDITAVNIIGITSYKTLNFNIDNDLSKYSVNNLNLILGPEGEIIFPKEGIYRLSVSVKGKSSGGLSVGNTATVLALRGNFGNDWVDLQQHEYLMGGLLVSAGKRDMVNSFTIDRRFKANDKIRLQLGIKADTGLAVGVGATFVPSDPDTFIYIEKLD